MILLSPQKKELGGFSVQRLLPQADKIMVGPWIFFDHMGPAYFPAGQGIDVRPHPHINLATVTYLFAGEILHRDSLGSLQTIRPGDINLMVAGRGITHSERETAKTRSQDHHTHGLQLWHALPKADEETDPAFYHYPKNDIPSLSIDGVALRILIGSAYGQRSPVKTFAETLYLEANLQKGQSLQLPRAEELALYVVDGQVQLDQHIITSHHMAILPSNSHIHAISDTHIAIIGGRKLSKRYIEWNFVSSRKARIEQAKDDWHHSRFDSIPGDDETFIPLPESID